MAKMIPEWPKNFNGSYGEKQVFDALKKLPKEYTIFHSLSWNKKYNHKVVWGEADFLILHKKLGLLVIEVKSGGIACENGQWYYVINHPYKLVPMKNDPLMQANRSKYRFVDLINEVVPTNRSCRVEVAVWFPTVNKHSTIGKMPYDYVKDIVLLEDALDNPQRTIERVFKFYCTEEKTSLNDHYYHQIVERLAPTFNAVQSLSSKIAEQKDTFLRMTNEQVGLLDYLEEQRSAAIHGVAGTGKTLLAVEKARRLSKEGKVLFICFNKYLIDDLRNKNRNDNIEYYNLYSLTCLKLNKPKITTDDILYLLNHYDQLNWDFTHIIIDEGQDFENEHIELLSSIAELNDGCFYIFYDKNQLVQKEHYPDWLLYSDCRLVLNKNCRNTFSIAETSGKPLNIKPKILNESARGDMPIFYQYKNIEEMKRELSKLISHYLKNGLKYSEICILTVKTESKSILTDQYIGKHRVVKNRAEDGILFTTVRKFKGLEAEVVIVIDVDEDVMKDDLSKRLFYVGTSRARQFLDLVYVGSEENLTKFANMLDDSSITNSLDKIALGLNVKSNI